MYYKNCLSVFYLLFFCSLLGLHAQKDAGIVEFKRTQYYINIMSKIPFYTQTDIDRERLTWGKNEGKWGETFQLFFKKKKTFYIEKPLDANYGYSWREDYFVLERDLQDMRVKDLITFNDQDFVVEGDYIKLRWKILNEIKEIAGFVCMKAESVDPIRNVKIHAWFTTEIPVAGGPEGIGGLPGMILELVFNNDDVVVTAEKISFHDNDLIFPYPKKYKGKKITYEDYINMYRNFIEKSYKSKRNPYWDIRY